jgi:hypothetical protein
MMNDLISRAAAIAEIEEYIEEYSELDPETGFHSLKWCAMEEAKEVLSKLLAVDAVPVEWLKQMTKHPDSYTRGSAKWMLGCWQREQERETDETD